MPNGYIPVNVEALDMTMVYRRRKEAKNFVNPEKN